MCIHTHTHIHTKMKITVKLLNGDLLDLDVDVDIKEIKDVKHVKHVKHIKHIKKIINEIDPDLFPIKSQRLTYLEDDLFFLWMDDSIKNEDNYECVFESYGTSKYTLEFYLKHKYARNRDTDIVFFEYNKKLYKYKWGDSCYSSLTELILHLPRRIRVPRSEKVLERMEQYWNNGNYYHCSFDFLIGDDVNSSNDENDFESNEEEEEEDREYE